MTITANLTELEIPRRFESVQYRTADIEHLDPDEGTVLMRAAPYGVEARIDTSMWETFDAKTFEKATAAPHRVKLWNEHSGPLIGHATEVEDRPDGIWIRSKFSNTLAGQEARELARDGSLDQCSVTFRPMSDWMTVQRRADGIHVRHSRAFLLGAALVAHGAYSEHAFVASVRDADGDHSAEIAQREKELRLQRILGWTH